VAECREAAEGLQALLVQGIFVDAGAAPAEAVAELQQLMDHISELKVMGHRCLRDPFMFVCIRRLAASHTINLIS